jgi:Transposase DDE domain
MYLRTIQRRNKDGSVIRYVQLAHNVRHPQSGHAVARVLHSFGREDQLDRDALARLVGSLSRYLGAAETAAPAVDGAGELTFVASRTLGGCWALHGLWHRLGLDELVRRALVGRRCDPTAVERVLFALVANRALDPGSKLASTRWVGEVAHVPGLTGMDEDAAYRAMDLLLEVEDALAEQVFWATATLLDLEVDLLFFDTSSTYFERDTADEPVARDAHGRPVDGENADGVGERVGFRTYGHSKDHREDLPQVVIGMAVTRSGIPIRTWCWPGNTTDNAVMAQVRADLRDWRLTRVVWVTDRGFASAENRRLLQRGGGHYIQAEKLRGVGEADAALARAGRYRAVAGNLRIKEVKPGHDQGVLADRFIVCHNPEQADRDAAVRERLLAQLTEKIAGSDQLSSTKRAELRGALRTMPGLHRYLRVTPGGLLRVDAAAVRREAHLDGKWLLRCSDPSLSPEDIAAGYKQLLEVERGWRDLKTHLDLRPVHHRKEDRIRAHVLLCWLALLLIRVAENAIPTHTWRRIREQLQTLHVGLFTGNAGHAHQRTELTAAQRDILRALDVAEPPRFLQLATTAT